jgi:hypothetical protein
MNQEVARPNFEAKEKGLVGALTGIPKITAMVPRFCPEKEGQRADNQ